MDLYSLGGDAGLVLTLFVLALALGQILKILK